LLLAAGASERSEGGREGVERNKVYICALGIGSLGLVGWV